MTYSGRIKGSLHKGIYKVFRYKRSVTNEYMKLPGGVLRGLPMLYTMEELVEKGTYVARFHFNGNEGQCLCKVFRTVSALHLLLKKEVLLFLKLLETCL
ncbi:MAG: hypothetical protein QW328_09295 [Nitrososphaerota archaeon]